MSWTKNQRKAMKLLDIETFEYIVTYDGEILDTANQGGRVIAPMIWGDALTHPDHGQIFIEHQTDEYGGNWRWYVRTRKGDPDSTTGIYKRKRDAILAVVKRWFPQAWQVAR